MSAVVLDEFNGRLPIVRIKYHAIYAICLRLLRDMATLKLQEDNGPVETASPASGFTFVETLLVAIVDHQRDALLSRLLPHLASLRLARQAILNVCADKTLSDFLWQF